MLHRLGAFLLVLALVLSGNARAADADYRLGSGDLVRSTVVGYTDLSIDVRVSESGNISYPYIGEVKVGGLSTSQAADLIAQRLRAAAIVKQQPQVSLLVMDYQSQKVSIMGQVTKPGLYPLDKASRVIDALALAGGVVPQLAADEANLIHKDGTKKVIDLTALFEGDPAQNVVVAGGDTVFVPKAPQFYIQGEVQRPGVYKLERDMTVSQAISAGGGLTRRGTARRVEVQRHDSGGKIKVISLKTTDQVSDDDVLIVKESLF